MAQDEQGGKIRLSKKRLAEIMKEIDFCMLTTVGAYGHLHSRPMSNNRNVEWDGDTWFFSFADSSQVREIEKEPNVNLNYSRPEEIEFISLKGKGSIVKNDDKKRELWYDDLKRWFPDGPEDNNVVLIRVTGTHVWYWGKEGDGELDL